VATFLALVLGAGVLGMAFAGILLLIQLGNLRARHLIRVTEPAPISAVVPGRRRIAVEGITVPGPAGPQVAPVTETGCAWYRTQLLRRPSRHGSGGDDPDHDVLFDVTSPDRPGLADGTGVVLVEPELAGRSHYTGAGVRDETRREHRGGAAVPGRFGVPDIRPHETLVVIEEWIPCDLSVYALARAGRTADGRTALRPGRRGVSVLIRGSRASALRLYREDLRTGGRLMAGAFGIGLIAVIVAGALLSAMG
jgi:hypothetical protein